MIKIFYFYIIFFIKVVNLKFERENEVCVLKVQKGRRRAVVGKRAGHAGRKCKSEKEGERKLEVGKLERR